MSVVTVDAPFVSEREARQLFTSPRSHLHLIDVRVAAFAVVETQPLKFVIRSS
jgi:hypothetical protein